MRAGIVEEDIDEFETDLHMHILRQKKIYGDNDVDQLIIGHPEWVTNYELTLTDDDD